MLGLLLGLPLLLAGGRLRRCGDAWALVLAPSSERSPAWTRALRLRALVLGECILAWQDDELAQMQVHELVHVAQYRRWGVFFLPAYAAASLHAGLRGGRAYRDNAFEREARRLAGENSRPFA